MLTLAYNMSFLEYIEARPCKRCNYWCTKMCPTEDVALQNRSMRLFIDGEDCWESDYTKTNPNFN